MLAWNAKIPGFSVGLKLQKYTPILVGKSKNSKDKQIYHKMKVSELQHDMRTQSTFESAQAKKKKCKLATRCYKQYVLTGVEDIVHQFVEYMF